MRACAVVAQLVRAPDCGSGGRWFEPTQLYHFPGFRHAHLPDHRRPPDRIAGFRGAESDGLHPEIRPGRRAAGFCRRPGAGADVRAPLMDLPASANDFQSAFVARLAASFDRATGGDLVREAGLDPAALGQSAWEGNFALLSHGDGAILTYANRFALDLWEMDWETMRRTPSSATAPPEDRAARAGLMEQVAREGFARHYTGRRVSTKGRLFLIQD